MLADVAATKMGHATLQKLLGHSSVAVTMKYAHLAPDFMRDEIARLRSANCLWGLQSLVHHHP
jgi:integrase